MFKRDGLSPVMHQVELGLMNENEVIIHRGVEEEDELYLTMPEDTVGIKKIMLSDMLTQN